MCAYPFPLDTPVSQMYSTYTVFVWRYCTLVCKYTSLARSLALRLLSLLALQVYTT